MPGIHGGRERIAQFWRAIELFSPQSLRKPDARGHVEDFYPGEPMPWEPGSQLASAPVVPGKVWRHEVFAGVYDIQRVAGTLVEQFGDDDPAGQRKAMGDQSALFGCTVDADGLLVEESAVLSSCAWAIGRLCAGGRRFRRLAVRVRRGRAPLRRPAGCDVRGQPGQRRPAAGREHAGGRPRSRGRGREGSGAAGPAGDPAAHRRDSPALHRRADGSARCGPGSPPPPHPGAQLPDTGHAPARHRNPRS